MNVPRFLDFQCTKGLESALSRSMRNSAAATTYNLHTICHHPNKLQLSGKSVWLAGTTGSVWSQQAAECIPSLTTSLLGWPSWWGCCWVCIMAVGCWVARLHGCCHPSTLRMSRLLEVMWIGALMRKLVQMVCSCLAWRLGFNEEIFDVKRSGISNVSSES